MFAFCVRGGCLYAHSISTELNSHSSDYPKIIIHLTAEYVTSKHYQWSRSKSIFSASFQKVKPFCVQLTQEALMSTINESKVVSLLTAIEDELKSACPDGRTRAELILLPNIADYIFFPISNLLKKLDLSDAIVQHILSIIGYLVEHCWKFNVNHSLFDQLFPLVLFLIGGDSNIKFKLYQCQVIKI